MSKELNKNYVKFVIDDHITQETKDKIKNTVYCIEGESYDTWVEWHDSLQYVQGMSGCMYTIGMFADMPITIQMTWDTYNGQTLMFYQSNSMVTYYDAIEEFLEEIFEKYSDHKFRSTDTKNNHIAMHHVEKIAGITRHSKPRQKFENEMQELKYDHDILFQIYKLSSKNFKESIYNLKKQLENLPPVKVEEPLDYNGEPYKYFD